MKEVIVKVLGSGNAFNQDKRLNSSYLIQTDGETILFDCGFTVPYALQKNNIEFNEIDAIVISHYHGDHFAGLAALILGLKYISPQKKQLRIIGPGNVKSKINKLIHVLYEGSEDLLEELDLVFIDVVEGEVSDVSNFYGLEAIPMIHSEESNPFGYVFSFENIKIGFSGDTCWHSGVEQLLKNSEVIFLECNFEHKRGKGHISVDELEDSAIVQQKKEKIFLTHLHKGSFDKAFAKGYYCVEDAKKYRF